MSISIDQKYPHLASKIKNLINFKKLITLQTIWIYPTSLHLPESISLKIVKRRFCMSGKQKILQKEYHNTSVHDQYGNKICWPKLFVSILSKWEMNQKHSTLKIILSKQIILSITVSSSETTAMSISKSPKKIFLRSSSQGWEKMIDVPIFDQKIIPEILKNSCIIFVRFTNTEWWNPENLDKENCPLIFIFDSIKVDLSLPNTKTISMQEMKHYKKPDSSSTNHIANIKKNINKLSNQFRHFLKGIPKK